MNVALVTALVLFVAASSFAQGILNFQNLNLLDPVTRIRYAAPVSLPDGQKPEGARFTAGLFLEQQSSLQLIATTPFREGVAAGYFTPASSIEVPGLPAGAPATFRARVWETAFGSYDQAKLNGGYFGEFVTSSGSPLIEIAHLGQFPEPGPLVTPGIDGVQPLTLVPEPQSVFLLLLGTTFFITRKR